MDIGKIPKISPIWEGFACMRRNPDHRKRLASRTPREQTEEKSQLKPFGAEAFAAPRYFLADSATFVLAKVPQIFSFPF